MRVLVYSSDAAAAAATADRLRNHRFNTESASDYAEAHDRAKIYEYDAIVVGSDAAAFTRAVRLAGVKTPVLTVTDDRAEALSIGADYALSAPVDADEFLAALTALVRRSQGHASNVIECGDISVNLDRMQITIRGELAEFTKNEYQLLQLLALRKGSTVTRDMMMGHLYGGRDEPDEKIIDVFVCKLRRKLRRYNVEGFITTVWGRGYQVQPA